jgi:hypothetical protein
MAFHAAAISLVETRKEATPANSIERRAAASFEHGEKFCCFFCASSLGTN